MRIVFDHGTPVPLRRSLVGHSVNTVHELGWSTLANGILLDAADEAGYELLITTDQNLRYQQNLTYRVLAVLVLSSTSWSRIRLRLDAIQTAVNEMSPGGRHWVCRFATHINQEF